MDQHASVAAFLDVLDPDRRATVDALRAIVLAAHPALEEGIKWNAASYALAGADRVTFNVQGKQGLVRLILHRGATEPEDKAASPVMSGYEGLIAWSSNIRGVISATSHVEVEAKRGEIARAIAEWLRLG